MKILIYAVDLTCDDHVNYFLAKPMSFVVQLVIISGIIFQRIKL